MGDRRHIPVGDPTPWKKADEPTLVLAELTPEPADDEPDGKSRRKARPAYLPDGQVPRRGLRGALWRLAGQRLYRRFGWRWLTKLSWREVLQNALDELWEMRQAMTAIAFVNSSGGSGKTTAASWYAAAAAFAFKGNVVVVDANDNSGHTAERLGVSRSLSLTEFIIGRGRFQTMSRLIPAVDRHRQTGAFVISSSIESDQASFSQTDYQEALGVLRCNFQVVLFDCGNGLDSPTSLGSVLAAERLVYVGNVFKGESLQDAIATRDHYAGVDGLTEKAAAGYAVIFGLDPKRRLDFTRRYGFELSRVFGLPANRYMANTDNPVRLDRLPIKLQAILFDSLKQIIAGR